MTTQSPREITIVNEFGETATQTVPGRGMLIQSVYPRAANESLISDEFRMRAQIETIHAMGEDAMIVVCAPVIEKGNNGPVIADHSASNGYIKYVARQCDLEKAGLGDPSQIRRDANALRGAAYAQSKKTARASVATFANTY